ncbi:MAG: hypothetical protein QG635_1398 [Bacteroidota bacterium]|nr:hypothetical protein [Bacteroidota bacterium]
MREFQSESKSVGEYSNRKNGQAKPYQIDMSVLTKEKPQISVIIPVLQEEKILEGNLIYLTKHYKSKYGFELIVSDGGSTDLTVEIAKKYADKVVLHEKSAKQTISEGRNNGAKAANGKIFVFLNADSIPETPDYFFTFIKGWAEGKSEYDSSDALACYVRSLPGEEIYKDRIFYFFHNSYVRFLNKLGLGMGRGECQIVRRNAFDRVGGYNELIVAGEDFDLYRRIAKSGKVSFVNNLRVCESPRRFRKYGYFKIIMSWTINALTVWLFGHSVSEEWEAVR